MSWIEAIFTALISPLFYKLTILSALPLIFASIGGVFTEKTGVTNIALEGIMKLGAFTSTAFTFLTGNVWIGLLMGIISGAILAYLHAYVSIEWGADQIVSATALIILAQGIVGFLMVPVFNQEGQSDFVSKIPLVRIPAIQKIPFIGEIFGEITIFFYIAIVVIIASWYLLYKTPLGLRMRAVGENPKAADTLGVNVKGIRYFGVLMSGLLAGLGGVYIVLGDLGQFQEHMPAGKGFIALAAMILGNWNPIGAMWASLLFGAAEAMNIQLQTLLELPSEAKALLNLLPFILTLIVVGGFVGKTRAPAASGKSYEKE
ncbi:ABC transporter permease [Oceanotoga sp. DSM 15011]|jgi:simple sugar transport system permease protein|uniref:Nucleoside ABC transporter membrane protein n=1 Tax=Oceanotoga teriensis TaxID=515440 RepID=A0AA45C8R4_9BACT|nr:MULTISPECIES: ABC transporter permease [Oceanotoga]MDN5342064.1 ral nucleoside transport system permease protein [Oceanotoga sp.]MDO7975466.1 ABC transporter permease [Oceanotoga teriensis]PWJ96246.1 nucleoside ABC transporter membrane protein [Oceanotoga teriensis]UYP00030.1 ABC transporter permease [Oceanotoga sp. DSM 15011]